MTATVYKVPVSKTSALWTNKTKATYTARITIVNPKPLPAVIQYWAGAITESPSGKDSVKISAKQTEKNLELVLTPGTSFCVFTNNRGITVEIELFNIIADKTSLDLTKTRQAKVGISVTGIKGQVTVGPTTKVKGVSIDPTEATVSSNQKAVFDISVSKNTNSVKALKFGILDRAVKANVVVEADCRQQMAKIYNASKAEKTSLLDVAVKSTNDVIEEQTAEIVDIGAKAIKKVENDPIYLAMARSYFKTS